MKVFSGYFFSTTSERYNFDIVVYKEEDIKPELEKRYKLPIFRLVYRELRLVYRELVNGEYQNDIEKGDEEYGWSYVDNYGTGKNRYSLQITSARAYDTIIVNGNSEKDVRDYFKKHKAILLEELPYQDCNNLEIIRTDE